MIIIIISSVWSPAWLTASQPACLPSNLKYTIVYQQQQPHKWHLLSSAFVVAKTVFTDIRLDRRHSPVRKLILIPNIIQEINILRRSLAGVVVEVLVVFRPTNNDGAQLILVSTD